MQLHYVGGYANCGFYKLPDLTVLLTADLPGDARDWKNGTHPALRVPTPSRH